MRGGSIVNVVRGHVPQMPRWRSVCGASLTAWAHRAVAVAVVAMSIAPLAQPVGAGATSVGTAEIGGSRTGQAQPPAKPMPDAPKADKLFEDMLPEDLAGQPIYADVKAEWDKKFKATTDVVIKIPAVNYVSNGGSEGLQKVDNFKGRPGPSLLWTEDDGWVEWEIDVPTTGLYEITMDYYPIPGKRASVQRDLLINGKLPFREAKRVVFQRVWKDNGAVKKDNQGNDVRPAQIEAPQWETKTIEDADGRYDAPFQFLFEKGLQRLRLQTVRETLALASISVHSPKIVPLYDEQIKIWKSKGLKEIEVKKATLVEAENPTVKSDPTVRGEANFDALASPYADGLFKLNSFGWWRWRLPGQWVRWEVEVPEEGLYELSFNIWQGWAGRRPRMRSLRINGEVPFREAGGILFRMERDWRMETMRENQLAEGKPYLFHLTKGKNVVQMDVTLGFMSETMRELDLMLSEMSQMSREMLMITGSQPDVNMEWDLHEKIPTLVPRLQKLHDRLELQASRMEEIGRAKNDASSAFRVVESQLQRMIEKPAEIHRLLEDFMRSQGILATWLLNLQNHPLAVEWLTVHSANTPLPRVQANVFEQTVASLSTFISSFTRDYTGLGSSYAKDSKETVLDVWVGRGTEWGQIMKDMIEDDFTPNTGIKVNVHVIPPASLGEGAGSVLLLATTAGEAPDVAVGVPSQLPVDFAVRKGLVNLTNFPDYPQIAKRFREGALVPFRYRVPFTNEEGNWAIPETQDFAMTFYRTDILSELGIKPPDTWDDLYDALLKLQQNGLDFYYPPPTGVGVTDGAVGFTPFLFQNGGEYYKCMDGSCRSSLDTPEALVGFQEWTDLYSNYKIPREANFFTRMRTGEQPIGVAGYGVYIALSVAAPELTGRWEMRPMPGHRCGSTTSMGTVVPCIDPQTGQKLPDGTIIRASGGTGASMVIFEQSKHKEESWQFVKWWSSKDAQQRFGGELEALIGVEARWNTANLEALQALPWPKKDIASIMEQWRWFREPPVVLGGYFTGRHVLNAWNRVVLQGMNPREALEDAIYDINKELAKKQEEFGVKVDKSMYRRG